MDACAKLIAAAAAVMVVAIVGYPFLAGNATPSPSLREREARSVGQEDVVVVAVRIDVEREALWRRTRPPGHVAPDRPRASTQATNVPAPGAGHVAGLIRINLDPKPDAPEAEAVRRREARDDARVVAAC